MSSLQDPGGRGLYNGTRSGFRRIVQSKSGVKQVTNAAAPPSGPPRVYSALYWVVPNVALTGHG